MKTVKKKSSVPQKIREQRREEERQRKIAKEIILPFLASESKDVNDARRILRSLTMMLTNAFQTEVDTYQKELSSNTLDELDFMVPTFKDYVIERKLLRELTTEKIHVVSNLFTNTNQLIESAILKENKDRDLIDLIGKIEDLK